MNENNFKLNDSTIAGLMQIIQAAIMTGTDILDLLRMLRLDAKDGELFMSETSVKGIEQYCLDLFKRAEEAQSELEHN
jgi:hypothetical protein